MLKHATITAYGSIVGTSITGVHQSVLTAADDLLYLAICNSCDEELEVSLDGGTTNHFLLGPYQSLSFDAHANSRRIAKPTIQVRHTGVQPTVGKFTITGIEA